MNVDKLDALRRSPLFELSSRDGFTVVVINIARVLSSWLRETNQKLAGRI
jgi:hypothetical protein